MQSRITGNGASLGLGYDFDRVREDPYTLANSFQSVVYSGRNAVMMKRARKSKAAQVGVVGKVIQILEQLDRSPDGLLLREIVDTTGINKSTAYRFLSHLERESYVFRDVAGYYMVGPKLAKLGTEATYQATLCRTAAPILQKICRETGESVNLGTLDGDEILYLSVFESPHMFRMVSPVGMRRPLYCTALGKAILAYLPADQQKRILAGTRFERYTPHTITSIEEMEEAINRIRRRGFAVDDEEAVEGARCVAAVIADTKQRVIGSISISGPTARVTKSKVPIYAAELRKAASEIAGFLTTLVE